MTGMPAHRPSRLSKPSTGFVLLCVLFAALLFAGGASRADVLGQAVVRATAWGVLLFAALWGSVPDLRAVRWPLLFLAAAFVLVLVQLVPVPPAMWQALPGRAPFGEPARLLGEAQPWRTIAIVPDAAINAASSLVVPLAVLLLIAGLRDRERDWLPGLLLGLILVSTLIGLVQFSGAALDHPLLNDTPGDVNGGLANRNHFALLLAVGCLLVFRWAFSDGRRGRWRLPVAFGILLVFLLTILATGSRMGMVLGVIAVVLGLLLARGAIRREFRHAPRWVFPAVVTGVVAVVAALVLLSVVADRAASIDRVFGLDAAQDVRARALPTVLTMIATYFPVGTGFGSFDPLFRMNEPFHLLKPTYFNHAHNDYLEIALDGGIGGILLLAASLGWWAIASVRAWRAGSTLRCLGSAILLLVFVASLSDYPARTPIVMAVVAVASIWLNERGETREPPTLPARGQQL